jgi:hypothetical protein
MAHYIQAQNLAIEGFPTVEELQALPDNEIFNLLAETTTKNKDVCKVLAILSNRLLLLQKEIVNRREDRWQRIARLACNELDNSTELLNNVWTIVRDGTNRRGEDQVCRIFVSSNLLIELATIEERNAVINGLIVF